MKRRFLTFLLAAILLFALAGCENATPVLAGTPTPAASPTPLPDPFTAEITASPIATDALGNSIDTDEHYWQYLSFGALRVYEYGNGTFLDGICVNTYPLPLDGVVHIVYTTDDGKISGVGTIHNALGTTLLETGSNAIYAEINTDIDVTGMDFDLVVKTAFVPVSDVASPTP
ncbi:MAG: hypothetical protein Q8S22_00780 [Eubacteriales bacterium]|jgi:hypothetical protein|nr:hypothetical protein [Eubacteriales bacterium]